jgi:hypothetical protein
MLLSLFRLQDSNAQTFGLLYLDGVRRWFTCEDEWRQNYIPGQTRIPAGTYAIGVLTSGSFHSNYAKRFQFHKGMLQILGIPGASDPLLIHVGKRGTDTNGGILVGTGAGVEANGAGYLIDSVGGYAALYKAVIDAALDGDLNIQVADGP